MPLPPYAKLQRLPGAVVEPLTLSQAKVYLRVETADEDDLINDLIISARERCEQEANRVFVAANYRLTMDGFAPGVPSSLLWYDVYHPWFTDDVIELPMPPLVAVSAITYVGLDQVVHTLPPASYRVSAGTPGQIQPAYGTFFPFTLPEISAVTIDYSAGMAELAPACVRQAMRLLIAQDYDDRSGGDPRLLERIARVLDRVRVYGYA